jgi:hypothetical protein
MTGVGLVAQLPGKLMSRFVTYILVFILMLYSFLGLILVIIRSLLVFHFVDSSWTLHKSISIRINTYFP